MTLWVVRHAQPLIAPGICYGALDAPADVQATLQAAERLAAALPLGIAVYTSTLQRCEQLAQVLSGLRPDLRLKPEPRLVEMNFGIYEGIAWADIPKDALDAWTQDFAQHRFGGQESVAGFMARVSQVWDEFWVSATPLAARGSWVAERSAQVKEEPAQRAGLNDVMEQSALPPRNPPDQVWITHAGVARAAVLLQQGIRLPQHAAQWPAHAPDFGGWIELGA